MNILKQLINGGNDTRYTMPTTECPSCHRRLNDAGDPNRPEIMPKPGDFTICVYCTDIFRYSEEFQLMPLTEQDMKDMPIQRLAKMRQMMGNNIN